MYNILFNALIVTNCNPVGLNARILAIGITYNDETLVFMNKDEGELLRKFWQHPLFKEDFRLIGFGCSNYEVPYLIARSFKHNQKMPDLRGRIIDLKQILHYNNDYPYVSLKDYARLIVGDKLIKATHSYIDLNTLYQEKMWKDIEEMCNNNLFMMNKVFERLKNIGVM